MKKIVDQNVNSQKGLVGSEMKVYLVEHVLVHLLVAGSLQK